MNIKRMLLMGLLVIAALLFNACKPVTPPPPTPTSTSVPSPTFTVTPTPGLGVNVVGGQWEIAITKANTTDSWVDYVPKAGYAMLVLEIRFRNLDPKQGATIAMKEVSIASPDESKWISFGWKFTEEPAESCIDTGNGTPSCSPGAFSFAGVLGSDFMSFTVQDVMAGSFMFPIQENLLSELLVFQFQDVKIPFEVK